MALFSKKPRGGTVADFWEWWRSDGARALDDALARDDQSSAIALIGDQVGRLHPDLAWEFGPGTSARTMLMVTGGGVPELRVLAERWRRAAPGADDAWEFVVGRRSLDLDGTVTYAGETVSLSRFRFGVARDEHLDVLDITVFHPAFSWIPDDASAQLAFLMLDWTLGEDSVERWVRGIQHTSGVIDNSITPLELRDLVTRLEAVRERDRWLMLSYEQRGEQHTRQVLMERWIDHPTLDEHVRVWTRYSRSGLPSSQQLENLHAFGEEWVDLPERAQLVTTDFGGGVREWHFYVDGEDQNAKDAVHTWARSRPGVKVEVSRDPGWRDVDLRSFAG